MNIITITTATTLLLIKLPLWTAGERDVLRPEGHEGTSRVPSPIVTDHDEPDDKARAAEHF